MPDIKDYTGKITSEHADKPKYMAMVEAVSQCFLDTSQVAAGLPDDFDLDLATDAQLDDVGLWVGISRNIPTPLTNVYFAFDTPGLGFDQGSWKGPFDPDNGITTLDNETYRSLLRAKIGANHWDGTLESSKAILDLIFNPDGRDPFIPVSASNETFATGDGVNSTFQLTYQGQNVYSYTSADLYKSDWQGVQKLYATPRTNLLKYSEQLDNAAWIKVNAGIASDAITAPDGVLTADKLIESAVNSTHFVYQKPTTVAGSYTLSVFIKAGERFLARLRAQENGLFVGDGVFDLSNGTVRPGSSSGQISPVGNGWYRCSITITSSGSATFEGQLWVMDNGGAVTYLGDGVSGLYPWGFDIEAGQITSYIPTVSASVTVTDYVADAFGKFILSSAPLPGAVLSWTGQGTAYAKGNYAYLVDNQDMTISIGLAGDPPSAIQWALLTGGYITPKPQSVFIKYFYSPTVSGPLFGFDVTNQYIAGFDQGSWGNVYP